MESYPNIWLLIRPVSALMCSAALAGSLMDAVVRAVATLVAAGVRFMSPVSYWRQRICSWCDLSAPLQGTECLKCLHPVWMRSGGVVKLLPFMQRW